MNLIIETKKRQENEGLISMCTMLINVHSHFKQPSSKKLFFYELDALLLEVCSSLHENTSQTLKFWTKHYILCVYLSNLRYLEREKHHIFSFHMYVSGLFVVNFKTTQRSFFLDLYRFQLPNIVYNVSFLFMVLLDESRIWQFPRETWKLK